jgi:hypothetical protein
MSKQNLSALAVEHPEIIAIALDIMCVPARRVHYSAVVLMLADAAIERIRVELASRAQSDSAATAICPPAPP